MKLRRIVIVAAPIACILAGCAGERIPPKSLLDARADLQRAHDGPAAKLDPADVHEADLALQRAEEAFSEAPDEPTTADLALVADRKALLAASEAEAVAARDASATAQRRLADVKAAELADAQARLTRTQQALGVTQMQLQQETQAASAQHAQLRDLETRLSSARATIARIAAVKDDDRGMVITLQGEVLFTTGNAELKPAAMAKLDQVAEALKGKEQPIVVFGYTDAVGAREANLALSRSRATAVRDYLVSKGIPQDLVTAQGKGPDEPIADNDSIEGRAQNRRVEIVVRPRPTQTVEQR